MSEAAREKRRKEEEEGEEEEADTSTIILWGKKRIKMALVSSWISLGKVIDDVEVKGFQTA